MPEIITDADRKAKADLDKVLMELPPYCKTFINAKIASKSIRTLLGYAVDLRTFFYFIKKNNPEYSDKGLQAISFDTIKAFNVHDIEEYVAFVKCYECEDIYDRIGNKKLRYNGDAAIRRKIAALSAFYGYFYKIDELPGNPVQKYELPRRKEKDIVILEDDEVETLMKALEEQSIWSEKELNFHKNTKFRDKALYTLLLSTGLRISEATNLNMDDLDFDHRQFRIRRKGDKRQVIGMSDKVCEALTDYIEYDRPHLVSTKDEPALFLSRKKSRLSPRRVQSMTRQINLKLFPMKHITPHKMRSTFGTNFQMENGDIYLTASALGHSDVSTTKKYYARQDQDKVTDAFRDHKL